MKKQLSKRLEKYPELKKHIESMLDAVENSAGDLEKADQAEIRVVDNMRKIGFTALREWAIHQEKEMTSRWSKEHPESAKHGKKKSTGKLLLGN